MKFIPIDKAKIEFGKVVFVKDSNGEFWAGKLKKKEETGNGLEWTFQVATFNDIELEIKDVTHIATPK